MKVRMITPNGSVSEISEHEAMAIVRGAFMRSGNVSVQKRSDGYDITDEAGVTLLTAMPEVSA